MTVEANSPLELAPYKCLNLLTYLSLFVRLSVCMSVCVSAGFRRQHMVDILDMFRHMEQNREKFPSLLLSTFVCHTCCACYYPLKEVSKQLV